MAELTFFTVTGTFESVVNDEDHSGDPDLGIVTGLVTFTPQVRRIESSAMVPPTTLFTNPIVGRIHENGTMKALDGTPVYYLDGETRYPNPGPDLHPVFGDQEDPLYWVDDEGVQTPNPDGDPVYGVRLLANSEALGPLDSLVYKVEFSSMKYNKTAQSVPSFTFTAPDDDVEVDIVTLWSQSS